jgi:hypothetical protein
LLKEGVGARRQTFGSSPESFSIIGSRHTAGAVPLASGGGSAIDKHGWPIPPPSGSQHPDTPVDNPAPAKAAHTNRRRRERIFDLASSSAIVAASCSNMQPLSRAGSRGV